MADTSFMPFPPAFSAYSGTLAEKGPAENPPGRRDRRDTKATVKGTREESVPKLVRSSFG